MDAPPVDPQNERISIAASEKAGGPQRKTSVLSSFGVFAAMSSRLMCPLAPGHSVSRRDNTRTRRKFSSRVFSGSNSGINILDLAMAKPVIVLDYDPGWPGLFQSLRRRIADALGDMAAVIEHIGSTAVPGLAAKPIIDIDVLSASETMLPAAIERLSSLGYVHRGNLGIPEREAFLAPANDPPHHLYVCPPCSAEFRRHVAFRDYLRAHPKDAKIYSDLKIALAERFREDRSAYTAAKGEFVAELTSRALDTRKK
jgi:GrpB-like predicted nucleotidyltransferase (UPF0157 family)